MKAHKLFQDSVLQPDQLNLVFEAFDAAWDEIKAFYHTPDFGRTRLAAIGKLDTRRLSRWRRERRCAQMGGPARHA
jgi:hypothetical protein